MRNRFITAVIAIVITITMIIPVIGAAGDNWGSDNAPWSVGITNEKLLGNYQIGDLKEFEIAYYPSDSVGLKAVRHIEITGDGEVSGFEYYEGGKWNEISTFTSEITFTETIYQRVRVIFNKEGIYKIKFWASDVSGEQSAISERVISVSNDGISRYIEPDTTKTPVTTQQAEPDTTETLTTSAQTEETSTDETVLPTLQTTTQPPTTVCPTTSKRIKVGTTSVKKATKKKRSKTAKISLKKIKKASGYQIQVSASSRFSKKATKTKLIRKTNYTIRSLKPGKKYYVRARAYIRKGRIKAYGKWSKKKVIKFI